MAGVNIVLVAPIRCDGPDFVCFSFFTEHGLDRGEVLPSWAGKQIENRLLESVLKQQQERTAVLSSEGSVV
jgi:hypothetical protein